MVYVDENGIPQRRIRAKIPKKRKKDHQEEPSYNKRVIEYYKTRWIVERTISWFGAYRRLFIRWERNDDVYEGFFTIAYIPLCFQNATLYTYRSFDFV